MPVPNPLLSSSPNPAEDSGGGDWVCKNSRVHRRQRAPLSRRLGGTILNREARARCITFYWSGNLLVPEISASLLFLKESKLESPQRKGSSAILASSPNPVICQETRQDRKPEGRALNPSGPPRGLLKISTHWNPEEGNWAALGKF